MGVQQIMLAAGSSFTPNAAFFAGAVGYAYDPSSFANMFQDSAGTTPVTATSQPLGRLLDLSGNGSHRTQATSSARPTVISGGLYQFDGSDDGMVSTVSTVGAGAWTHIIRVNIGADTVGVLVWGPGGGDPYFGFYRSGFSHSTYGAGAPVTAISVAGSSVADNVGTLYTALTGASRVMATNLSSLNNTGWASTIKIGDYPGFTCAMTVGREILIKRTLTGADLANALAWVGA